MPGFALSSHVDLPCTPLTPLEPEDLFTYFNSLHAGGYLTFHVTDEERLRVASERAATASTWTERIEPFYDLQQTVKTAFPIECPQVEWKILRQLPSADWPLHGSVEELPTDYAEEKSIGFIGMFASWTANVHVSLAHLQLTKWFSTSICALRLAVVNLLSVALYATGIVPWVEHFDSVMAIPLPASCKPRLKSGWTPGFGIPKLRGNSIFPYVVHPIEGAPSVLLRGEPLPPDYQVRPDEYDDILFRSGNRCWTAEDLQEYWAMKF